MAFHEYMPDCPIVQFTTSKQTGEKFALTKLWGQDNQDINKCKDTPFLNWVITKQLLQQCSGLEQWI